MAKRRLGKGLGALISENKDQPEKKKIEDIYIENIEPNPYQPREDFNEESLAELGASIKEKGVIQPITVRRITPEKYQLVAGERRWRAARMVGLKKIPALVQDFNEAQMMEIALIENLQREDLNPIEEAQAYQKMIDEFEMTQAEVARKVGKSRSSIANTVRLLNLPPKVQIYVSRETLTVGHARTLLALKGSKSQIEAASHIIENELSVRETEKYISDLKNKEDKKNERDKQKEETGTTGLDERWKEAEEKLSEHLGTRVRIKKKKQGKQLTIHFDDEQHLKRIVTMMFHMKQL